MTSRSTKGRQLSTSIAKPSSPTTSSASSETAVSGAEAPAGAHAEDFKRGQARAAFNGVRQQLRGLEGVRFGIAHPARLRITYNGTEKSFLNPEEAQAYVTQTITPHAARTDRQMPS
ncbi:hypothetical protein AAFF_G00056430 [Aldrovandia affinis]|uniref:Uncharacterized protein n=1 Tax=Aldrovandia affinis TaxID=143900 RepID=A0AAD7VX58_9TELE|nr:hypothetical protein AAFF_G00056430 [Aldrovandia affinis]